MGNALAATAGKQPQPLAAGDNPGHNDSMEARLGTLETAMTSVNRQFSEAWARFAAVEARLDRVEHRLSRVESQLEKIETQLSFSATKADVLSAINSQTRWIITSGSGLMLIGITLSKMF